MKKSFIKLIGLTIVAAAMIVIVPTKDVKAANEDYIYTQQAQEFLDKASWEYDQACQERDEAQRRLDSLRNQWWTDEFTIWEAQNAVNAANDKVNTKLDKREKAKNILYFCQNHSSDEIYLASMQEKFKNEASLAGMQQQIQGAQDAANGALYQAQNIQQAIATQTELAKVNPAINAQVVDLTNQYNAQMAEYQERLNVLNQLQAQYAQYTATLPLPTADDKVRLAQIRESYKYTCELFDQAVKE